VALMDATQWQAQADEAYIRSKLEYSALYLFDFDRPRWERWVITFSDGYEIRTGDPAVICRLQFYREQPAQA
jgi:hypothetical protein